MNKSGMRRIELTKGRYTLVDDEDYEQVNQHKWHAVLCCTKWYARRTERIDGKSVTVSLHRLVVNARKGEEVDHINGDGLDNRRSNLRLATREQNQRNRVVQSNSKSGYKGVFLGGRGRHWAAQITIGRKRKHLGYFQTPEDAARAYDEAAREHYGEFAKTNF